MSMWYMNDDREAVLAIAREFAKTEVAPQALEIDREIPPELYRTIAEVMAYVYRIDKKAKKPKNLPHPERHSK